ncbi:hypothetical protein [Meiothermus rufus]|nr:hypothetical protein [Meiothermus rufus]
MTNRTRSSYMPEPRIPPAFRYGLALGAAVIFLVWLVVVLLQNL